ncbi:GTP-binding protein [[Clostridium] innocuum]|nr:GTP-binding protein [[Clostridium] innocuum]
MNNINIGMLAHVDAGKTTLSESLLYVSGSIRQLGRVDHGNAFLDYDAQEKDRGITIYAKQAIFDWKDTRITLLDTPGHVDFSAEMERVLQVLDYAVVIINALDGIQSHTETIWKLLQHYHVPALVFVNKMDVSHTERTQIMEDLKRHLDEHCVDVTLQDEACQEQLAMCSDELLESYMETGGITDEQLADAVAQRTIFPCCFGSALKMEGIQEFLDMLNSCTKAPAYPEAFGARIFKISRDENGWQKSIWMRHGID